MWKFLIGVAAGYLAGRATTSKNSDAVKPLAKAAVKTGIKALEKGYEAASNLRERLEDVFAEARADLDANAAAAQRQQEAEPEQPAPKRSQRRATAGRAKPRTKSQHASASHD